MSETKSSQAHIVIVGAGIAGLSAAIALKRQLNFSNVTIYERAERVGGTWQANTYPGCSSDLPGHWYSLSTHLNPQWHSHYPSQAEILAYWEDLWRKYDLAKRTVLETSVTNAIWDPTIQAYTVHVQNVQTKATETVTAHAVFWAKGPFQEPRFPVIPGHDRFKGPLFHSSAWRHDVTLKGKKVGVIGNGCSGAQLITEVAKDPSVTIINFCRSPQWYVGGTNFYYPKWLKWIFSHVPFVMRVYRGFIMARYDINALGFRADNKWIIAQGRKMRMAYLEEKAPRDELANLTPNYTPGCKRLIVDRGYLDALNQPNVSLAWDAIVSFEESGVMLRNGEFVELDVIVCATGFKTNYATFYATGSNGLTLADYFASKGGPTAYAGMCVPHFPNLFLLHGPNSGSGHASVLFAEESQISYAVQLLRPVIEGKVQSLVVTDDATDKYNTWLRARLQRSVWTGCTNYYQDSKKRNFLSFPGPLALLWWICLRPDWRAFRAGGSGAQEWGTKSMWQPIAPKIYSRVLLLLTSLSIAAMFSYYWIV